MGQVDLGSVRPPEPGEVYIDYLGSFGLFDGTGFVYRELVWRSPRHQLPPRYAWSQMVATLRLAIDLRERMRCVGASGLVVRAAFRPEGGETDSQHKHNTALDLDLLAADVVRDPELPAKYARVAAVLWRERSDLRVGLGTYAGDGHETTRRVHLDTGYRWRCWQGIGSSASGRALFSVRPAALRLAQLDEKDPAVRACIADGQ